MAQPLHPHEQEERPLRLFDISLTVISITTARISAATATVPILAASHENILIFLLLQRSLPACMRSKPRIIATNGSNIFARLRAYHIAEGDASFFIFLSLLGRKSRYSAKTTTSAAAMIPIILTFPVNSLPNWLITSATRYANTH